MLVCGSLHLCVIIIGAGFCLLVFDDLGPLPCISSPFPLGMHPCRSSGSFLPLRVEGAAFAVTSLCCSSIGCATPRCCWWVTCVPHPFVQLCFEFFCFLSKYFFFFCFFLPIRLQLSVSQSVFRCAASRFSPKALVLISYFCSASGLETR